MELYKKLREFGKVKINEPLAKHTTFKIGGNANLFVIVDSIDKLTSLLKFLNGEGVNYFILGGGSNMLASDNTFGDIVIKIIAKQMKIENDLVVVDAGCPTVEVAQNSVKENLTGFEWGVGVPGTMGGAVRGNAGAVGGEMKDNVEKVEVFRDGEIIELSNAECEFKYRDSVFKNNNDVILRVYLRLAKSEGKELMKKAMENIAYRNKTQPQGFASTGCIFKNIKTNKLKKDVKKDLISDEFWQKGVISAGWLVQEAGLKGEKVGKAQVSDKHGNFIVNLGGATAQNVMDLIDKVKEKVYDKFGIELEEEIQLVNF